MIKKCFELHVDIKIYAHFYYVVHVYVQLSLVPHCYPVTQFSYTTTCAIKIHKTFILFSINILCINYHFTFIIAPQIG